MYGRRMTSEKVEACANCGAPLSGDYCARCGQSREDIRRPALSLVTDTLETLAALERGRTEAEDDD